MVVTLQCEEDELTLWFSPPLTACIEAGIERLPNGWLLVDQTGALKGLRLVGLRDLCPYELAKVARANAGHTITAELLASYDASCDMGYVYLDKRGPASVDYTVDAQHGVYIDIGKDGAVLGLEIFSPSHRLPELARAEACT